ncbi:hypothetical protein HZQ97_07850 [Elizabethkingia anophelis]|uniref:hypothetical protein n=1 Tax=Elizabethkingia TaxID=308865 RepID=UPI0021A4C7E4|nr:MULTISPECIES: hypothetical protein [unclassified Elizabethkingia]MCT3644057.1 hypothetical protein [Elizabethkingia anophelis]MCT3676940.1 hypothetical protein [Elizabethkingia anophelis]MCT3684375.1 hypothetical protein [Elizabethkingia anophelis]MDX8560021.1 hypothetical protein [Elizabethkingia sp. HX ZCH]MDX8578611.1 hypothetical protein [Elizabethkingia sp. HX YK]
MEQDFYDENSYFESLRLEEEKHTNIFDESNYKINIKDIRENLRNLKQQKKKYSTTGITSLGKKFIKIGNEDYEGKLKFWIEKELNPLNRTYLFNKEYNDEKFVISMNIEPKDDKEKNLYFKYLTEWINEAKFELNNNETSLPFTKLKENYDSQPNITEGFLIKEREKNDNRIQNSQTKEIYFTQKFIEGFRSLEGVIFSDLHTSPLPIDLMEIVSYLVSPVIGYLKYEKFLRHTIKKKNFTDDVVNDEIEKEYSNTVDKARSFKRIKFFRNNEYVDFIRIKLIEKDYIEEISLEDFLKVFDNRNLKEISKKIIWKIPYKNSTEEKISYDWKSLLYLIRELVEPDFEIYSKEIRDIINTCFDFPDGTLYSKSIKSFTTNYVKDFKKKEKINDKKMDEIFKELYKLL